MSATLDEHIYMDYFDTQHFIEVKGEDSADIEEIYPNDIQNLEDYVLSIVKEIKEDTLLFLPTVKIINKFKKLIEEKTDVDAVEVYSGVVESEAYNDLFIKPKKRIILATDTAETGVTFPYLVNVIDSGLVFSVSFNPQYNCTVMSVAAVGKQSATQRRGRVGRVREGKWYPCFTKDIYENKMVKFKHPEMMISDITVKFMNIINIFTESEIEYDSKKHIHGDISQTQRYEVTTNGKRFNPLDLEFINRPSNDMISYAMEKLYVLGFIDSNWNPTMFGVLTSHFRKINIESIKMILSSIRYDNISIYVIIIAACLSVGTHKLGRFKDVDDDKKIDNHKDELINYVIIYQKIMDEYQGKTILENKNIEEWFNNRGLKMDQWNNVIELVYELSFSLIKCGYFVNPYLNPKLTNEHVKGIKQCIYEGYRINLIVLRDGEYYTNYKNIKLEKTRSNLIKYPMKNRFGERRKDVECYLPNYFITTSVIYSENIYTKKMGFNATTVSIMDDYVMVDEDFFY
jgi:HrpA-like RNA helicase